MIVSKVNSTKLEWPAPDFCNLAIVSLECPLLDFTRCKLPKLSLDYRFTFKQAFVGRTDIGNHLVIIVLSVGVPSFKIVLV